LVSGRPAERLGIEIVVLAAVRDRGDERVHTLEGATAETLVRDITEEALDHIHPS
jgi:hypothetical protein